MRSRTNTNHFHDENSMTKQNCFTRGCPCLYDWSIDENVSPQFNQNINHNNIHSYNYYNPHTNNIHKKPHTLVQQRMAQALQPLQTSQTFKPTQLNATSPVYYPQTLQPKQLNATSPVYYPQNYQPHNVMANNFTHEEMVYMQSVYPQMYNYGYENHTKYLSRRKNKKC